MARQAVFPLALAVPVIWAQVVSGHGLCWTSVFGFFPTAVICLLAASCLTRTYRDGFRCTTRVLVGLGTVVLVWMIVRYAQVREHASPFEPGLGYLWTISGFSLMGGMLHLFLFPQQRSGRQGERMRGWQRVLLGGTSLGLVGVSVFVMNSWSFEVPRFATLSKQSLITAFASGCPPAWGSVPADYSMDNRVRSTMIDGQPYGLRDAIQDLPVLVIHCDRSELFGEKGIYLNPERRGRPSEILAMLRFREGSKDEFVRSQCGMRIHGGISRNLEFSRKQSFRLYFRDDYGGSNIAARILGVDENSSGDVVVLRAGSSDSWAPTTDASRTQFVRDEYARRIHERMGHVSARGRFLHVYLNGMYWGVYNVVERIDEGFLRARFPTQSRQWEVIKDGELKEGHGRLWRAMIEACQRVADAEDAETRKSCFDALVRGREADTRPLLDVDNYIDYMLVNFYVGNKDWPSSNYVAAINRDSGDTGYQFFLWDAEWTLNLKSPVEIDMVNAIDVETGQGVAKPHSLLRDVEEYRSRFRQRVAKHMLSPDGALFSAAGDGLSGGERTQVNRPRGVYARLCNEIQLALLGESARWGDMARQEPYRVDVEWTKERDYLLNTYFSKRPAIVRQQLQRAGLATN